MDKLYRAIGLMSGTSADGIDLALIESDGKNQITNHHFAFQPYDQNFREKLSDIVHCSSKPSQINLLELKSIENELTILHADLVNNFLNKHNLTSKDIDVIGFHGHTILHNPDRLITWQIGNAYLLANKTKIKVISDFRTRDVVNGGHGAPLVPIYHFYLLKNQANPGAILNIGGVANITYFNGENEDDIEAFDIGFGIAPFDDLVKKKLGIDYDLDGKLAIKGTINFKLAEEILANKIFHQAPPKSFHRQDFKQILSSLSRLETADNLATMAYILAQTLKTNLKFLSTKPKTIFISGGGRKNQAIIKEFTKLLEADNIKICLIDEIGLNGDSIEAEAFGFLAIRSLKNLPISFKKTTGAALSLSGGVLYLPD